MAGEPHWAAEVRVNGESVLVIEPECLAGKSDMTEAEVLAVREAARHLMSFIGDGTPGGFEPEGGW